jgi:N-acetyl-gamma-glutamyl-phosphate reductase
MQCTSYVKLASGVTVEDLHRHLTSTYEGEPFVRVLAPGVVPHTRHVRGSNFCFMNVFPDRQTGRAIVISVRSCAAVAVPAAGVWPVRDRELGISGLLCTAQVIDNLVKGASGQGLQNLNLMMGWPETTALGQLAMFP